MTTKECFGLSGMTQYAISYSLACFRVYAGSYGDGTIGWGEQ